MADDAKTLVVGQGAYVARVAAQRGLTEAQIWSNPANAELVEQRRNPNVLAPGDVLRLPATAPKVSRFHAGEENTYTAAVPTLKVRARFKYLGKPIADAAYALIGLGSARRGTTDARGIAELEVTALTEQVVVQFDVVRARFRLRVGFLDPAAVASGARQRLRTLGYLVPTPSRGSHLELTEHGHDDPLLSDALSEFQRDAGLPQTGELDADTARRLAEAAGV